MGSGCRRRLCQSPPARRRGLKPPHKVVGNRLPMSPPARRRGLKQCRDGQPLLRADVASRAEAWIETIYQWRFKLPMAVASRAEAWIETFIRRWWANRATGRLPRGGVD